MNLSMGHLHQYRFLKAKYDHKWIPKRDEINYKRNCIVPLSKVAYIFPWIIDKNLKSNDHKTRVW